VGKRARDLDRRPEIYAQPDVVSASLVRAAAVTARLGDIKRRRIPGFRANAPTAARARFFSFLLYLFSFFFFFLFFGSLDL